VRAEGGAAMVAAPVRDLRGRVVAALHTFASEMGHGDAEALRAAVIKVAQELSGGPEGPCGPVAGAEPPPIGPVTD
jgi:DNA-binding IclR family transcriptional regulator